MGREAVVRACREIRHAELQGHHARRLVFVDWLRDQLAMVHVLGVDPDWTAVVREIERVRGDWPSSLLSWEPPEGGEITMKGTCRIANCDLPATEQNDTRCALHDWAWICEFCFTKVKDRRFPIGWEQVFGCAICPSCWDRVQVEGGIDSVPMGSYTTQLDPRDMIDIPTVAGPWMVYVDRYGDSEVQVVYDELIVTGPDGSVTLEPVL